MKHAGSKLDAGGKPVSRETRERLDIFVRELRAWQKAVNLVSPASLAEIETRHIADSLQLVGLANRTPRPPSSSPAMMSWVDLGSGGGLPGLVVAAAMPERRVILIESDARKCAFLRHAAAAMAIRAEVRHGRIEAVWADFAGAGIGVVSARAVAPLTKLLDYAQPFLAQGAVGLFPKGRSVADELTEARKRWHLDVELVPSRIDSEGCILRVRRAETRVA